MKEKNSLKFTDYFWIFMLGGLVGYVLEIVWYFIKHHIWVIKNGVIFGPFQPIYGFGILLITILLYKLKDKNWLLIVLGGTIIGFVFEYSTSLFQEKILGTYTWTYKRFGKLAINGRTYIPYCIAWGFLGLLWIRIFLPKIVSFFRKIPSKLNKILVIILFIFMTFNLLFTAYVFHRKSDRYKGIEPRNKIEVLIEENYNDDFLDERFPNLWIFR